MPTTTDVQTGALDVAVATARDRAIVDEDEQPLIDALAARGVRAGAAPWDGSAEPFDAARLTLLRSTWDYHLRPEAFRGWIAARERLANPREVALWNVHKGYLLELAAAGVPVVPTILVPHGAPPHDVDLSTFAPIAAGGLVVKPAISAGSWRTERVADAAAARVALADLADIDALVQPLIPSVFDRGETAVICIEGRVSHAVRKRARFRGDPHVVQPVALEPRELAAVDRVLEHLAARFPRTAPLLYSRVDLVAAPDGEPLLMELELLEPSLYLATAGNVDAFADAVVRALHRT